ncbi:lipopolysaccharide biosynthesis protein [Acidocella aquatica]|uniref:Lipopolysaccharide biosynthesis protein n=1 Tax=Acidocella aquatica TaxID=1922313 RepID=A0ABQ6ACR2_9PROT|nr:oligosaccharide flippase family protein [Acidocella aquatica]GLR67850.1 lipopolysaccharide biosynthesis protein [Acidocella aquatica]
MNLARGAARGAAWSFAAVLVERGFGFVILGLLLRVIPASVVGLIAIASAISELARVVANSGAGEQVQANPGDRAVEAGAFWSQGFASLVFMAVLFAISPSVARLYGQPQLSLVLRVMAVNVLLTAFLIVPSARLTAQFRFRAIGLISLGSTMAGGLVALPFAYRGYGVAAMIAQRMAGVVFYALVAAVAARWVPPALPPGRVLRESFRFSWPLMQAAFVDYISLTGYVMLVGLRMPVALLGQLRIAQRLAEVLQEVAFLPGRKVFIPVFVAVRGEPDRQFETTRQMLDMLSMVIFFASAVCGAAARPIVLLMFGPHWAAAAPVFAILTLMAPASALYGVINPLLTAAGRTRLVSHYAWANVAAIMLAAWFAAPFGLNALAWALAGRGVLGVGLFAAALRQGLGRPVGAILRLLVLPCLALVAARLAGWCALVAMPGLGLAGQLVLAGGVAALVFAGIVMAAAPARMRAMAMRLRRALLGG